MLSGVVNRRFPVHPGGYGRQEPRPHTGWVGGREFALKSAHVTPRRPQGRRCWPCARRLVGERTACPCERPSPPPSSRSASPGAAHRRAATARAAQGRRARPPPPIAPAPPARRTAPRRSRSHRHRHRMSSTRGTPQATLSSRWRPGPPSSAEDNPSGLSKPPQKGTASWNLVCTESDGGVRSKMGQSDTQLPESRRCRCPARLTPASRPPACSSPPAGTSPSPSSTSRPGPRRPPRVVQSADARPDPGGPEPVRDEHPRPPEPVGASRQAGAHGVQADLARVVALRRPRRVHHRARHRPELTRRPARVPSDGRSASSPDPESGGAHPQSRTCPRPPRGSPRRSTPPPSPANTRPSTKGYQPALRQRRACRRMSGKEPGGGSVPLPRLRGSPASQAGVPDLNRAQEWVA